MLSIRVGAINREKQWLVAAVVCVLHLSKDEEGSISIARAGRRYTLTRELGSSGPYAMLFCLDDLDKKKHRDVINSLKKSFF